MVSTLAGLALLGRVPSRTGDDAMSTRDDRWVPPLEVFNLSTSVLVVGSGAAGIQASMDLAKLGFKVKLVERDKHVGGLVVKLDKTYATNDCTASARPMYTIENAWVRKCLQMEHGACGKCHLAVQVYNNPNIELHTNSSLVDVEHLDGGNMKVVVETRVLGIDEAKCNGCGKCREVCPVRFDEDPKGFDAGLGTRRAVDIPFQNAIPPVYTIEQDKCIHASLGICSKCQEVCPTGAVTFRFETERSEWIVGAIVVATGAEQAGTTRYDTYLGHHLDVLNALQFERLASPNGPTGGRIIKPSNRKPARRVAFLQCIGSRNHRSGGKGYCSTVCCMYAIKEADMVKEWDKTAEAYIFNVENRAYLKGFHEYYLRAKHDSGVTFVHGRVSNVRSDPSSFALTIQYEDIDTGTINEKEVDLVVLSTALIPNTTDVARALKVPLNEHQYFDKGVVESLEQKGVYIAGFCLRPMDIPASIVTASAAVAKISRRMFRTLKDRSKDPFYLVDELRFFGEPRVGVLVCRCDAVSGGVIDETRLLKEISKQPGVVAVDARAFGSCTDAALAVSTMVKDKRVNRVVVGGCSPRSFGNTFRKAAEGAGIDPFLLELVNIREQATWVHRDQPEEATRKVIDLLKIGIARTSGLVFQERKKVPVAKAVLIIGGGPAGIAAADNLANQGMHVHLVERETELGGAMNKMSSRFLLEDEEILVNKIRSMVTWFPKNELVHVYTRATVASVSGAVGNFSVVINQAGQAREVKVGGIVVATGASEDPRYENVSGRSSPRVFNQEQFEALLAQGELNGFKRFGFIQCVNQRSELSPGEVEEGDMHFKNCSGICCKITLKQAIKIQQIDPGAEIHVMQRGMQLSGEFYNEENYHRVQRFACFERYDPAAYPVVSVDGQVVNVRFREMNTATDLHLELDALVLATPYRSASDTRSLAGILGVPVMQSGYFLEAHVKFRPNDFIVDGMFLAGDAHWPKTLVDAVAHGYAAAGRVASALSRGYINIEENVAEVDQETCIGCGKCVEACPYDAIDLVEASSVVSGDGDVLVVRKARVNDLICKGCGTCVGGCPTLAIEQRDLRNTQLSSMVAALFPLGNGGMD